MQPNYSNSRPVDYSRSCARLPHAWRFNEMFSFPRSHHEGFLMGIFLILSNADTY
jgi:hypothetical protein